MPTERENWLIEKIEWTMMEISFGPAQQMPRLMDLLYGRLLGLKFAYNLERNEKFFK